MILVARCGLKINSAVHTMQGVSFTYITMHDASFSHITCMR